ncbi:hypothetical protein SESBI_04254 [Sesbania bispinosa]|nr:hypothetical protein SESBI_04254 [Sesbania bispinosa]
MKIEVQDGDTCMEEEKIQIVEDSLNGVEFGHTCEENIEMVEDSLDGIKDNDACIEEENVEIVEDFVDGAQNCDAQDDDGILENSRFALNKLPGEGKEEENDDGDNAQNDGFQHDRWFLGVPSTLTLVRNCCVGAIAKMGRSSTAAETMSDGICKAPNLIHRSDTIGGGISSIQQSSLCEHEYLASLCAHIFPVLQENRVSLALNKTPSIPCCMSSVYVGLIPA